MLTRYTAVNSIKKLLDIARLQTIHPCTGLLDQSKTFLNSTRAHSSHDINERAIPVYHFQNPFKLLKIKWQILKLKNDDKDFNEKEFIRGSKQAISTVTSIVKDEKLDNLEGLFTPFALAKLRGDVLVHWDDEIVRNIDLKLSDIKIAVPINVLNQTTQLPYTSLHHIDMWYFAVKWMDSDNLLAMDLAVRFSRNFTDSPIYSDWIISFFELKTYNEKKLQQM